ncbi:hypothetical protein GCM10028820_03850 [Tessaracoccus terricola]
MTATAASRPSSPSRPRWVGTARRQLRIYLYLYAVVWAILLVGIVAAIVIVDRLGTVDLSIAQFVRNGPLFWFVFALAIIVPTGYLTPHVANGLTRRSFTVGSLVAVAANALLHSVTTAVVLFLEGAFYAAMGWEHDTAGKGEFVPGLWEQGFGVVLLDYSIGTLAGGVSGLLLGICFYRFGGWRGTLMLPISLAPLLVVLGLSTWGTGDQAWLVNDTLGAVLAAALVVAAAAAFALLVRNVRISRMET